MPAPLGELGCSARQLISELTSTLWGIFWAEGRMLREPRLSHRCGFGGRCPVLPMASGIVALALEPVAVRVCAGECPYRVVVLLVEPFPCLRGASLGIQTHERPTPRAQR